MESARPNWLWLWGRGDDRVYRLSGRQPAKVEQGILTMKSAKEPVPLGST